jgi:hypothetical protein
VEATDACFDSEFLAIREVHFFGVQLLEAIPVLRSGWPGSVFLQSGVGRVKLDVLGVDACRRRVINTLDTLAASCRRWGGVRDRERDELQCQYVGMERTE